MSDPLEPVTPVVVSEGDDRDGSAAVSHRVAKIEYSHSGPLPPPVDLEHYERTLPGAADRIVTMAEQVAAHRRHLGDRRMGVIEQAAPMVGRGVFIIVVLVVLCVTGLAALLIVRDFVWAGASVVLAELLSTLIALIVSAVRSRRDPSAEPEQGGSEAEEARNHS